MADKKNATQKEFFTALRDYAEKNPDFTLSYVNSKNEQKVADTDEIIEFCDKRLEQLDNKATSSKKKTNDEHDKFVDVLLDVMSECGKVQCSTLLDYPEILNFPWADGKKTSGQRVSYILNSLEKQKIGIVKTIEKKISYFEYVKTSDEAEG